MLIVIVPYRDRKRHLGIFTKYMAAYLRACSIPYKIMVIEQEHGKLFNRGKLLNIGFAIADKLDADKANYYIMHDVDMLPIMADYEPCKVPTHLITDASQFANGLPYEGYFGGVTLFPREHFILINGYSNDYWGWGSEDDDLLRRIRKMGLTPERREIGIFESLEHEYATADKTILTAANNNYERLVTEPDLTTDGLTTLQYELLNISIMGNVEHYSVKI